MIVETGLLRVTVPDEARDDSLHTFRRNALDSVTVDVVHAPKVAPAAVVAARVADVESWAEDLALVPTSHRRERAIAIPGLRDAVVVKLWAPELDGLYQTYLAGRLESGDVVCLRYSKRARAGETDDMFESVLASVRVGARIDGTHAGWQARMAYSLALALPAEFAAPRALTFVAREWRLSISHGTDPTTWRAYFRGTDDLHTLDQQHHESEVGSTRRRWIESTLRVRRRRLQVVANNVVLAAEITDEHVVREATLQEVSGRPLGVVGVALAHHESSLNVAWQSICSSLEEQRQ